MITAAQAGGVTATIWIAAGTYFESLQVMLPSLCARMLTYAHVYACMLTYAAGNVVADVRGAIADVC